MKKIIIICLFFGLNSCSQDRDVSLSPVAITLNFAHSWGEDEISSSDFDELKFTNENEQTLSCLLYTSPSPRDRQKSRMPSSA